MKLVITDIENISLPLDDEYKIIQPQEQIKHCIGLLWLLGQNTRAMRDTGQLWEYGKGVRT